MKVLKGIALGLMGFFLLMASVILGAAFTVNSTGLNPQFLVTEVEKLDINTVVPQIMNDMLPSDATPYIPAINATLNKNKSWINEQISYTINRFYDYLLGKTNTLNINISTVPIKQSLAENLTQIYIQTPPPEYSQLPSSEQAAYLNQLQQQVSSEIPSTITVDQSNIPPGIWQILQQARDAVGYFRTAYFALIAFIIALILLIIFTIRKIKGASLSLGIIFIIVGAISLAAFFILQKFVPGLIPINDLPAQLKSWITQLITDLLSPWKIFGIIVSVLGALLLVTSFFLHGEQRPSSTTL